jgi:hypothetical protein
VRTGRPQSTNTLAAIGVGLSVAGAP